LIVLTNSKTWSILSSLRMCVYKKDERQLSLLVATLIKRIQLI
jgi:hypothetical protein